MTKLTAGVARTVINPPVGADLCGYAGRTGGCTGVHDDLYAKALALSDGETRAAIVTLDLVGLNAEQVRWIREEAGAKTGIPEAHILIGASHTHSGPATQMIRACGSPDDVYVRRLLNEIAYTIEAAAADMRPVRFGAARGESHIAINRRYRAPSGEVHIGDNVGGVTDPEVGIWYFADESGKPVATIFNYACHAVVMSNDNLLVSADWPGAAQRAIESAVGGQAMFLQGCCGNINPRERATFEVVEKLGGEVAYAVLDRLPDIASRGDVGLEIASDEVRLPLQPPPTWEEAKRFAAEMVEALKKADESTPLGTIHVNEGYRDWALTIASTGGRGLEWTPMEIQRLSLGDAHILALPGEVFVEYALDLKKVRPNVIVAGYANGNVGYVPTKQAFGEGGYEVDCAYRLYGEQMLAPEVEEIILDAGRRLLAL